MQRPARLQQDPAKRHKCWITIWDKQRTFKPSWFLYWPWLMEINGQAGCQAFNWRVGKPVLFKMLKTDTLRNHSTGKQAWEEGGKWPYRQQQMALEEAHAAGLEAAREKECQRRQPQFISVFWALKKPMTDYEDSQQFLLLLGI